MGGGGQHRKDGFPASTQTSSSNLGLRDAIDQAQLQIEFDVQERAQKLINSMRVLAKVKKASQEGRKKVTIAFPKSRPFGPDTKLKKGIRGSDVVKQMMRLISEEGIFVKFSAGKGGGCCSQPTNQSMVMCPDLTCGDRLIRQEVIPVHIEMHTYYSCLVCSGSESRDEHTFQSEYLWKSRWRDKGSWIAPPNPPIYGSEEAINTHISLDHTWYCQPCQVFVPWGEEKDHIRNNHQEYRKKGFFGGEVVETLTIAELQKFPKPVTSFTKKWGYNESQFVPVHAHCKNCSNKFQPLSEEDSYVSMELSW